MKIGTDITHSARKPNGEGDAIWDILYGKKDGVIDLIVSLTQGIQQIIYNPISISSHCYMGFGIRLSQQITSRS
jgi:hypothetical protein